MKKMLYNFNSILIIINLLLTFSFHFIIIVKEITLCNSFSLPNLVIISIFNLHICINAINGTYMYKLYLAYFHVYICNNSYLFGNLSYKWEDMFLFQVQILFD